MLEHNYTVMSDARVRSHCDRSRKRFARNNMLAEAGETLDGRALRRVTPRELHGFICVTL